GLCELRQRRNELFGQTVDDRRVARIAADVRERKHDDRAISGGYCWFRARPHPLCRGDGERDDRHAQDRIEAPTNVSLEPWRAAWNERAVGCRDRVAGVRGVDPLLVEGDGCRGRVNTGSRSIAICI